MVTSLPLLCGNVHSAMYIGTVADARPKQQQNNTISNNSNIGKNVL